MELRVLERLEGWSGLVESMAQTEGFDEGSSRRLYAEIDLSALLWRFIGTHGLETTPAALWPELRVSAQTPYRALYAVN